LTLQSCSGYQQKLSGLKRKKGQYPTSKSGSNTASTSPSCSTGLAQAKTPQWLVSFSNLSFVFLIAKEKAMEFTVSSGGLPPGAYSAQFVGAEPYTENEEKYGPGVSLKFKVTAGEHAGEEASRICAARLTPKSSLGKFAVALKGSAILVSETFNFASYVGTVGTILVEQTDNGGSRITTFLRSS
jgi:hypothetical protein